MARYLVQRLLLVLPVLLVVSRLIFGAVRVIPGDVCRIILNSPEAGPEQCKGINAALGLNRPVASQYVRWLGLEWFTGGPKGVLQGDFGNSISTRRPVSEEIVGRFPVTAELAIAAISFAVLVGIPVGAFSAINQNRWPDSALRILTIGWLSIPGFGIAT